MSVKERKVEARLTPQQIKLLRASMSRLRDAKADMETKTAEANAAAVRAREAQTAVKDMLRMATGLDDIEGIGVDFDTCEAYRIVPPETPETAATEPTDPPEAGNGENEPESET